MRILIAATSQNNALGKDNKIIWHLPDDFKRFKQLTTNHYIIMGRKTFESFPKPAKTCISGELRPTYETRHASKAVCIFMFLVSGPKAWWTRQAQSRPQSYLSGVKPNALTMENVDKLNLGCKVRFLA